MIELSECYQKALDSQEAPVRAVDPRTHEIYVLLKADVYEKMRTITEGFAKSAAWDDPRLDVYEEYRKT